MAPSDINQEAFRANPSPGVFRQFGVPMDYAYVPLHLNPLPRYYQTIARVVADFNGANMGKKPPFRVLTSWGFHGRANVNLRVYPPQIAVTTLRLDLEDDIDDLAQLIDARLVARDELLRSLIDVSTQLVVDGRPNSVQSAGLRTFCGIKLELKDGTASDYWAQHDRLLTGLTVGVRHFNDMSLDIVRRLESSCAEFNKKSIHELLLVSKQGLVLVNSPSGNLVAGGDRFSRVLDLTEIASVMRGFLQTYLSARLGNEDLCDFFFSRIRGWIQNRNALFSSSVSNRFLWTHLVHEFSLGDALDMIENENLWLIEALRAKAHYFAVGGARWWENPGFASHLAGILSGDDARLRDISDASLRQSILQDLAEAERALASRSYKSALVMSGATAEAILLAILLERTSLNEGQLLRAGLSEYVSLVRSQQLTIDSGTLNVIDQSLRDWRNLVHPGKQLRTGAIIDEHKAQIAVRSTLALISEVDKPS